MVKVMRPISITPQSLVWCVFRDDQTLQTLKHDNHYYCEKKIVSNRLDSLAGEEWLVQSSWKECLLKEISTHPTLR